MMVRTLMISSGSPGSSLPLLGARSQWPVFQKFEMCALRLICRWRRALQHSMQQSLHVHSHRPSR
jgi:hypothetical protein